MDETTLRYWAAALQLTWLSRVEGEQQPSGERASLNDAECYFSSMYAPENVRFEFAAFSTGEAERAWVGVEADVFSRNFLLMLT